MTGHAIYQRICSAFNFINKQLDYSIDKDYITKYYTKIRRFKNLLMEVNSMNYNKLNPEEERVII
ncbi:MAG: hypothetical protein ACXWFC_13780, partial [Nitrososphaeraceae archaeon]